MSNLQTVNALTSAIDNMIDKIIGVEITVTNYLGKIENLQEYTQEQAQKKVDEMCERVSNEVNAKLEEQRTVLIGMISKTIDATTVNIEAIEPIANFDLNNITSVGDVVSFLVEIKNLFTGPYSKAINLALAISTDILPKLAELASIINSLSNLKNLIPTLKSKDGKIINVDKLNVHIEPITESDTGCIAWKRQAPIQTSYNKFRSVCSRLENNRTFLHFLNEDGVFIYGFSSILDGITPISYNTYIRDNYSDKTWVSICEANNILFLNNEGLILREIWNGTSFIIETFAQIISTDVWNCLTILNKFNDYSVCALSTNGSLFYNNSKLNLLTPSQDIQNNPWNYIYCDYNSLDNSKEKIYTLRQDGFLGILEVDLSQNTINLISEQQKLDPNKSWQFITKVKSQISNTSEYFMAIAKDGYISTSNDGLNWSDAVKSIDTNEKYILVSQDNSNILRALTYNGSVFKT